MNDSKEQQTKQTNPVCLNEPLKDKLTENRFVRLFLYGMHRDFENHKPLYLTDEQSLTLQIELQQQFEIFKKDIVSATKGLYDEFTKSILETSDLDPINIVRHFGDIQMKWFEDVINEHPKVKSR